MMKKPYFFLATGMAATMTLTTGVAFAIDFATRAEFGDNATSSPTGKAYMQQVSPVIQKSIQTCIPPGSTAPANLGKFTYVATVDSTGLVTNQDVQPHTKVSDCFSGYFTSNHLPPPPAMATGVGFPITIEMNVTQ